MAKAEIPFDKYDVKLSGTVDSLRKRIRLVDLASVFSQWRAEAAVYAQIEKTSCLIVSVTRVAEKDKPDPMRQSVNISVRYRGGDGADAIPEDAIEGAATVQVGGPEPIHGVLSIYYRLMFTHWNTNLSLPMPSLNTLHRCQSLT